MVILGVDPYPSLMRKLASAFVRAKVCAFPQVIDKAKVPIVKFIDSKTGIQVDISFNQENGIQNTIVVNRYLKEFDALRPLVMVLKYFMQSRDLQEPYTGGIGSYALTLMAVSFLQVRKKASPVSIVVQNTNLLTYAPYFRPAATSALRERQT
jgi:non-canonical poly(A) RNA polymerase PAPD5/7